MAASVYLVGLKAIVTIRERADMAKKNEFQKSLDIHTIYRKNDIRLLPYENQQLRILNWNIERGFYPDQLVKYLQSVNPDIACLQEVDWGNERTGGADVLGYIARQTGMSGYFGVEFFEIASPYRSKRMAGGGVHGNAILTRINPSTVYRVELPRLFDWEKPAHGKERIARKEKRIGARFALCADFQSADSVLTVCTAHFEDKMGGADGRVAQLKHLVTLLDQRSAPPQVQVIAGDMNTLDNWLVRLLGVSRKQEAKHKPWYVSECKWWTTDVLPKMECQDPFTCKDWTYGITWLYRQKLDWMLLRNAKVLQRGIGDFNSSDHRPLWIDIVPNEHPAALG